jgi:hypothetical protein
MIQNRRQSQTASERQVLQLVANCRAGVRWSPRGPWGGPGRIPRGPQGAPGRVQERNSLEKSTESKGRCGLCLRKWKKEEKRIKVKGSLGPDQKRGLTQSQGGLGRP